MTKVRTLPWLFALLALPVPASAWLPCQPFCDAGCGGAALQAMGASVAAAAQGQTGANQGHLQAINSVIQSTVNFGVNMSDEWTQATMDILSGLDASTSRIELAKNVELKNREYTTDAITQSFKTALTETFMAERVAENQRIYLEPAMPETGEIGPLAAAPLKSSYLKSQQLVKEITGTQVAYSQELTVGDASIAISTRLSTDNEVYESSITVCTRTLSNDQLNNLQTLLTYLINPNPLPTIGEERMATTEGEQYELARRAYNSKLTWLYAVTNQVVANKAQYASTGWVRSYVHRDSNEPELSFSESLAGLINGRVTADGWYQNVKNLNETGLYREYSYLRAEENALLFLLSQRRAWRNELLSLLVLEKLRAGRTELAALAP